MIDKEYLRQCADGIGVALDETALCRFDTYAQMLVTANENMNLTGITEPDDIVVKHFTDCLALLQYVDLPQGCRVADVGTGAGFPGLPLLFARPDLQLTLLDALQKRLGFLSEVLNACDMEAALVHARAEDAGHEADLRETFDFVTARAVAPLGVLSEYCLPLLTVGGTFAALKGTQEDFGAAFEAVKTLGGSMENIVSYKLTNGDSRSLVIIKKISQTPTQYPRSPKKITRAPL